MHQIPYRKPQLGRDYWIQDKALPNAEEIAERCLAAGDWILGHPYAAQPWPGKRWRNALRPEELARVEALVHQKTSVTQMWRDTSEALRFVDHNSAQLVGEDESRSMPHTDAKDCRFAGVLYLTPGAPPTAGTSFYRLRNPDGSLGGNQCPPQHASLREALGVPSLPMSAWHEELAIPNVFNRLVFYRSDLVHAATSYFGVTHRTKRLTIVFFWKAA
jgi:hypothetical protein